MHWRRTRVPRLCCVFKADLAPCRRQHTAQTHFAERYVHLASRQLARQAWHRRDRSAAHNLNWILQEVCGLDKRACVLLTYPTWGLIRG